MKSIKYSTLFVLLLFQSLCLFAQSLDPDFEPCGTKNNFHSHDYNDEISYQNYRSPNGDTFTYVIPIVFHVQHEYGPENVSYSAIENAVNQVNRNFNRENEDTLNIPEPFRKLRGKLKVKFMLARKDPDGNCIDGVIRYNISDVNSINTAKWKKWEYCNIVVKKQLDGKLARFGNAPIGYSNPQKDINIRYDEFPLLNSKTLTHELGHYLNLLHVFDDYGTCSNGDRVDDTPAQNEPNYYCQEFPHFSCQNQVYGDNFNNFMDYSSDCRNMFSQGQIDRMKKELDTYRSSLYQDSTHQKTDILKNVRLDCGNKPIASFGHGHYFTNCTDYPILFNDASSFKPTSWTWFFDGGSPSTSTAQHPEVYYSSPGDFNVKLIATNEFGSDTFTHKVKIVKPFYLTQNTENFESDQVLNRIKFVTAYSIESPTKIESVWPDIFKNNAIKAFDMNKYSNGTLAILGTFYLEEGKKYQLRFKETHGINKDDPTFPNELACQYFSFAISRDECNIRGLTDYRYFREFEDPIHQFTLDSTNSKFVLQNNTIKGDTGWNEIILPIDNRITGKVSVSFFKGTLGQCSDQKLLGPIIDDIVIEEVESTSTNEFESEKENWNMYPNPTNSIFKSEKANDNKNATILIYDINGTLIKSYYQSDLVLDIDISNLKSGIYMIKYQSEYFTSTKKLIKL
ncbi:MAG TPA: M43 family zinc metalloprotease [Saprospiraceae bacterium]|nr:M43 family zinc metalloprotease [Saprospiraceae bacterium]